MLKASQIVYPGSVHTLFHFPPEQSFEEEEEEEGV